LNPVDLVLVALLAVCAVRGYVRGLFRETMGLAGLVIGGTAALVFARPGATFLHRFTGLGEVTDQVLAAILIFGIVNLLTHLLAVFLDRVARAAFLSGVTRVAGAVVAVGKGTVIVGLVLFFLESYVPFPTVAQAISKSTLGAPLVKTTANVLRAGTSMVRSRGVGKP
jgi:uncharacterized membrane protein required for colicin V production